MWIGEDHRHTVRETKKDSDVIKHLGIESQCYCSWCSEQISLG